MVLFAMDGLLFVEEALLDILLKNATPWTIAGDRNYLNGGAFRRKFAPKRAGRKTTDGVVVVWVIF
jgi:hypothetical protein